MIRLALAALLAALAGHAGAADPRPAACTDFYAHVNADWLARTELPPERARIGSFDELRIANDRRLELALQRLVAEPARQDTPGLKQLAAWYASALDPAIAQARGLQALQPWLARIDALAAPAQLAPLWAALAVHGVDAPLRLHVGPDLRDVRRAALFVGQGGLGLPDRDDYLNEDATSQRLRAAYRGYAARLLQAAGSAPDAATIDALLALETTLAHAAMSKLQRRDPQATANWRRLPALQAQAPGLDWASGFDAAAVDVRAREFVVSQPAFMRVLAEQAQRTPLAVWQIYLRVRLLDAMAPWLPAAFADAHFDFHERALRGLQAPPPRSEALIRLIGGPTGWAPMGQALGELFVREAFPAQARQRAAVMIEDIRTAMRARISSLDWMGAATRQRALAKLAAMKPQVGAPAHWPDYHGLTLDAADPAGNALQVAAWGWRQRLAELDQPTDREHWQTGAHIVNAFAGSLNRIVFPAGILQPPFFDAQASDATNYGAIGMVIGHEITHHFDDRGRQFDADGNLADWWDAEDASAYRVRAQRVVALYGAFEPLPGLRLDGRQMLGENISDLAGLQIAFDALGIALQRQAAAGQPAAATGELSPQQQFFVANAVIWRGKQRPEALEQQIRTGQHSPGPLRVRAPMAQMPAFAAAWGCRPGDAMTAREPVAVW